MILSVLLEVVGRVDRELADHALHVHRVVGLPEDVVVTDHYNDGQIVAEERRPDGIGPHSCQGDIVRLLPEPREAEKHDVDDEGHGECPDKPLLQGGWTRGRRGHQRLRYRGWLRFSRFVRLEGKSILATSDDNAL